MWGSLPVNFLISSSISSLPFDFGILPRNKRVFGSLTFILRLLPSAISYESSCGKGRQLIVFVHKSEKYRKKKVIHLINTVHFFSPNRSGRIILSYSWLLGGKLEPEPSFLP